MLDRHRIISSAQMNASAYNAHHFSRPLPSFPLPSLMQCHKPKHGCVHLRGALTLTQLLSDDGETGWHQCGP